MNTQMVKRFEVGQEVYVQEYGGYRPGKVVRVTPTWMTDIIFHPEQTSPTRFKADGRSMSSWDQSTLDTEMSFEDRTLFIERLAKSKEVAVDIRSLYKGSYASEHWSKQELMEEVVKLEAKVAAIRLKVEAI